MSVYIYTGLQKTHLLRICMCRYSCLDSYEAAIDHLTEFYSWDTGNALWLYYNFVLSLTLAGGTCMT